MNKDMNNSKNTILHRCKICNKTLKSTPKVYKAAMKRNNGITRCRSCSLKKSTYGKIAYKNTPIYRSYADAKTRCTNPNKKGYENYGGRGITFKWDNFESFREDMEPSWFRGATIERKNNDGNYEKSNCKWATRSEQARNKRNSILSLEDESEIRNLYARGDTTYKKLALKFGIKSLSHIGRIIKKENTP